MLEAASALAGVAIGLLFRDPLGGIVLVVRIEEVAVGWAERQLLRNLGTRLYGQRQVEP